MSEEQRKDEEAEVEAHRKKKDFHAEPSEEGESENDFEAHRLRHNRPKKD